MRMDKGRMPKRALIEHIRLKGKDGMILSPGVQGWKSFTSDTMRWRVQIEEAKAVAP